MLSANLRRIVAYLSTGVFFFVAATGQLHGDSVMNTFLKAGVACAVIITLGLMLMYVVDQAGKAATVGTRASDSGQTSSSTEAAAGRSGSESKGQ